MTSINGVKNSFYSLKDCVEVRYDMTHQVFTTRINTKNVPLVTMGDFKISFKLQSIDRESFVLLRDVTGSPEDLNPIAYYQEYTESITTYVGTISTITPSFEIYSYNN
ncbi:MAG: hypothetical protein K2L48_03500 [Mycoplasmoidaceae bacterium]|nr:hypothetical protein [Mycoplasmoidaceae bacterium]